MKEEITDKLKLYFFLHKLQMSSPFFCYHKSRKLQLDLNFFIRGLNIFFYLTDTINLFRYLWNPIKTKTNLRSKQGGLPIYFSFSRCLMFSQFIDLIKDAFLSTSKKTNLTFLSFCNHSYKLFKRNLKPGTQELKDHSCYPI